MQTIAQPTVSVNSVTSALFVANARLLKMQREFIDACGRDDGGANVQKTVGAVSVDPTNQSAAWLNPLRAIVARQKKAETFEGECEVEPFHSAELSQTADPAYYTIFGTIATAILRHDGGTVGRVWLVLRAHFAGERQSGMISAADLWASLTENFPQYSRRHLRDLLQRGEGIYWQRDAHERLWLTGITTLAVRLGVERIEGKRVIIPLADLTGKLSRMRLALQAAFHASRNHDNPISRATLRDLTGISERAQREQENAHAELITTRLNYSIDGLATESSLQTHAFRHQQGAFQFTDSMGQQGKQGDIYLAHQLPNSYTARYQCAGQGRKHKINRQLTDNRVNQGARGTGWQKIEQVFYRNGAELVAAINRGASEGVYPIGRVRHGTGVWVRLAH
jgi:hypothetical protein